MNTVKSCHCLIVSIKDNVFNGNVFNGNVFNGNVFKGNKVFNLTKKKIIFNDVIYDIERFEVWYRTPFGLIISLDEAIKQCVARELDPELMIVPVPVAISGQIYEQLLR